MATPRDCEQEARAIARTEMLRRMRAEASTACFAGMEAAAKLQFRMSPGAFAQLIEAINEGPDDRGPDKLDHETATECRFRGIRTIKDPKLCSNFCLERTVP